MGLGSISSSKDLDYIFDDLEKALEPYPDLYLHLQLVGSSALLCAHIESVYTEDIDTIHVIEQEVQYLIDALGYDINTDAMDYFDVYMSGEWEVYRDSRQLYVEYLSVGDVIRTKMLNIDDPNKMYSLAVILSKGMQMTMSLNGIVQSLEDNYDYYVDGECEDIITTWIRTCEEEGILVPNIDNPSSYVVDTDHWF